MQHLHFGPVLCSRLYFVSDADRDDFFDRLRGLLAESKTGCYAWALIPNHFHLLLRTGTASLSSVMRRLLTGYAVSYNFRHHRYGHLFQNRYKSILLHRERPVKGWRPEAFYVTGPLPNWASAKPNLPSDYPSTSLRSATL